MYTVCLTMAPATAQSQPSNAAIVKNATKILEHARISQKRVRPVSKHARFAGVALATLGPTSMVLNLAIITGLSVREALWVTMIREAHVRRL